MKGKILTGALFGLGLMAASQAQANYLGYDDYADGVLSGNNLTATGAWNDPNTSFTYNVDFNASDGTWLYTYTLSVDSNETVKDISHLNIEVTEGCETCDPVIEAFDTTIISITEEWQLGTQKQGPGNPEMPGDMYGIKWDTTEDSPTLTVVIESTRGPMWGDFYAKDGTTDGTFNTVRNAGFGTPYNICFEVGGGAVADDCWSDDHILVPDSFDGYVPPEQYVPVPAAVWLFGSGLLGLVGVARRKRA